MKKLFTLLSVIFFALNAWAETNKIYYTSNDGNIVKPYQTDAFGANIISNEYKDGQGVITFDGPVTSIDLAFYRCTSLTSITIPEGVTSIQGIAFSYCPSLTSIVVEVGNPIYDSRENCNAIIETASNTLVAGCKNTIIPNTVTSIGSSAFEGCSSLTSITIPAGVTYIASSAFRSCESMTTIVVEAGNTIYDSRENCNAIIETASNTLVAGCKNTIIPNTVKSIGDAAFDYCSSLTSITIPEGVTSIGYSAFSDCSSLTSITIPEGVTSIGEWAFHGCKSLTSITIPEGVTSIRRHAFGDCFSLTSITIPEGVTSIEEEAFHQCSSLTSITIPNSVTSIGGYAFCRCHSLTSITIPEGVTSIGEWAFSICSSLATITISEGVTSIGSEAFSNCSSLTSIVVEAGNTIYDSRENCNAIIETATNTLVTGCKNTIIPNTVKSIGYSAFYNCTYLTSITIPEGVTSIGSSAFRFCSKLDTIYVEATTPPTLGSDAFNSSPVCIIPCGTKAAYEASNWKKYVSEFVEDCIDPTWQILYTSTDGNIVKPNDSLVFGANIVSNEYKDGQGVITFDGPVTSIGEKAFYDCSSLSSITIPNSVTSIGKAAFTYCPSLPSITIPNSVTSIGKQAFDQCYSLTSIAIPNSVASIGIGAFSSCYSLTSMVVEAGNTKYDSRNNCNAIIEIATNTLIAGCQNTIIPNTVTSIGEYAFYHCKSLTSITIPNSVTSIGEDAFDGCTSLTSITIPESVNSIGDFAFNNCSSLTSMVVDEDNTQYDSRENCNAIIETATNTLIAGCQKTIIPNTVINIGDGAFGGSAFASVVIPESVTSIGYAAFHNCRSLTSVTIGSGVISIREAAFDGCKLLTSITIPNSVTSIGYYAFTSCSSLNSVTLGSGVTSIGERAFRNCTSLTSITCEATTPPTLGSEVFQSELTTAYIPCGTKAAYEASDWKNYVSEFVEECTVDPTWQILYTSTDGNIVTPYKTDVFGANIISNEYKDGQGVITFDGPVTSIGDSAFFSNATLKSITIPSSASKIGSYAFKRSKHLTTIIFPYGINSIEIGAFSECSNLTDIGLPNSINHIGNGAFSYCSSIKSVKFPKYITTISPWVFEYCSALSYVNIPEGVTSIGHTAFYNCPLLHSITLPQNIANIEKNAFHGTTDLDTIYSLATTPATINSISFAGNPICVIPCGTKAAYEASDWKNYVSEFVEECTVDPTWQILYTSTDGNIVEPKDSLVFGANIVSNEYKDGQGVITFDGPVTSIGNWAFFSCKNLESITIPQNITILGENAFHNCTKLRSINIHKNITTIESHALYQCAIDSLTIHKGVTKIGDAAFRNCKNLKSIIVEVGNSIYDSRNNCNAIIETATNTLISGCLNSIIPNNVVKIGSGAFWGTKISSIDIPNSVEVIDDYAFYSCDLLEYIDIPNSVSTLGQRAYGHCSRLSSISIPKTLHKIGVGAFSGCSNLTSIVVEDGNTTYDSRNNCNAIIKTATNTLIAGCNNTIIPISVDTIGEEAFAGNHNLQNIDIPGNIKAIKNKAFEYCLSLKSIDIPEGITTIQYHTFYECQKLVSITIPSTINKIETRALAHCSELDTIYCKATTPPAIDTTSISKSISFCYIPCGTKAAYEASDWKNYVSEFVEGYSSDQKCGDNLYWCFVDSTLTITGDGAMYDFEHITQPWSAYRTAINKVELPDGITHIGVHAFAHCDTLLSINMPNSITSIGAYAFGACEEMGAITLPQNLTQIGDSAFAYCFSLQEISLPQGLINTGKSTFYGCINLHKVTLPNSLTIIGENAFSYCRGLYDINLPNNLTQIGDEAFANCDNLLSITIPESVTSLGWSTFINCRALRTVELPSTLKSIGEFVFEGCSLLENITLPNSVSSIGKYAFYFCVSLPTITIPESVKTIGEFAFSQCVRLDTIYAESNTPAAIQSSTFNNYNVPLVVPCVARETYKNDSIWGKFKNIMCIYNVVETVDTICPGETYTWTWNGQAYTDGGVYRDTVGNDIGLLELIVRPAIPAVHVYHNTCDPYTWNGTTYDKSGEYTYVCPGAYGCDSTTILHLYIPVKQYKEETITACESYDWKGTTYTSSGDYVHTTPSALGCDSIVETLHLTINHIDYVDIYETACDSYTWNGITYTTSGTHNFVYTNINGCDSIVTLHLTINQSQEMEEFVTACDIYTWHGQTYTTSGTYYYNTTGANGCNLRYILHLTINNTQHIYETQVACNSYVWHGQTYTTSGSYTYTTTGGNGCNLVYHLDLTINHTKYAEVTETACDSYTWNGQTYTTSGDYTYTTTGSNGCDSITTLHLTINNTKYVEETATACNAYNWNGQIYTTSGDYTYTTTGSNGCDSITTLHLTINQTMYATETVTACDAYTWNGKTITTSGNYTYITTGSNGCDSITTLHLTINKTTYAEVTTTAKDYYTWNGTTYTTSGDYTYTTTGSNGCDSITTLHLIICKEEFKTILDTICDGEEYIDPITNQKHIISSLVPETQTWKDTVHVSATLDSIYTFRITPIVAPEKMTDNLIHTLNAEPWLVPGTLPDTTGTTARILAYYDMHDTETIADVTNIYWSNAGLVVPCGATEHTLTLVVEAGCNNRIVTDHIIDVIPMLPSLIPVDSAIICHGDTYLWPANNQTYSTTGLHAGVVANQYGCDSTIYLYLEVLPEVVYTPTEKATICHNESYQWAANNQDYTTKGTYTHVVKNVLGCDSIIYTLDLTVLPKAEYKPVNTATVCHGETYTWTINNKVYNQAGTYYHTIKNSLGCDSIIYTLDLTVLPKAEYKPTMIASVCHGETYTWTINNKVYNQTGTYYHTIKNSLGCDSIVYTLDLTVLPDVQVMPTEKATICYGESYRWSVNNKTYATKGTHTHVVKNSLGCDSIIYTLELAILPPLQLKPVEKATICYGETYKWSVNNQDYATSGYHSHVVKNSLGCDSILYTLNLTVLPDVQVMPTEKVTICHGETYTWSVNNKTYTTTCYLNHVVKNSLGCDSIIYTLDLTILPEVVYHPTEHIKLCDGETYYWSRTGQYYDTPGVYTYTISNHLGCDSIIYTLNYETQKVSYEYETATICNNGAFFWVVTGKEYNKGGTYHYTLQNAWGCDSIYYTLEVTELPSVPVIYLSDTICGGETYFFNGVPLTETNRYYLHTNSNSGCDSTVILDLTVLPEPTYIDKEVLVCQGETYRTSWGQTLNKPGHYSKTISSAWGCDSIVHSVVFDYYQQTMPDHITYPVAIVGLPIDVTAAEADIQSHIDYEGSWYAPNAEITWLIRQDGQWAQLTTDPVEKNIVQLEMMYTITTDCGTTSSDILVVPVLLTGIDSPEVHGQGAQKFFYDGRLYILREGKLYNAQGAVIEM